MTIDIRAFFFDLDGTLMDTEKLYVKAIQSALVDRDCFMTDEESLQLVYGKGWYDVYAETTQKFPNAYPVIEDMENAVWRHFVGLRDRLDVRIHSSIDLLKRLSADYAVAIVSGSHRIAIQESVELMEIENCIQFFLGAEDYGPGKPSPACYQMAAQKLNVGAERCLVFEDSTAGVQSAKAAGMHCVGLRRNGAPQQDLSTADLVLNDLSEFDLTRYSNP